MAKSLNEYNAIIGYILQQAVQMCMLWKYTSLYIVTKLEFKSCVRPLNIIIHGQT
jgi:hypothetical protein